MRKVDTSLIVRLCLPQFAVGLFTTMRTGAAFPYAAAVSFILPAGTDARQFTELSDAVIRFAPIDIDKQQYASVHGENKNISVDKLHLAVDFYKTLLRNYPAYAR